MTKSYVIQKLCQYDVSVNNCARPVSWSGEGCGLVSHWWCARHHHIDAKGVVTSELDRRIHDLAQPTLRFGASADAHRGRTATTTWDEIRVSGAAIVIVHGIENFAHNNMLL